jgi:hypothetical protein
VFVYFLQHITPYSLQGRLRTTNDKRQTTNDKRQTTNDKRQTTKNYMGKKHLVKTYARIFYIFLKNSIAASVSAVSKADGRRPFFPPAVPAGFLLRRGCGTRPVSPRIIRRSRILTKGT